MRARLTSASGLQPGNRRETIACREKARTDEAIVLRAGQRKTRMAKAGLPEPQSSGVILHGDAAMVEASSRAEAGLRHEVRPEESGAIKRSRPSRRGLLAIGGIKGANGRLIASELLNRANTGSPKRAS
jgi:hypothetical protein